MALVLAVLSLLPMLVGFLTAGDFPQMLFKPPLWLVRVVYGSRYLLIALSLVLYFSAIIVHLLIAPTSIFRTGLLTNTLGMILFSRQRKLE
jgi:hypothetical protein